MTAGWRYALSKTHGPTALVLSRQDLPVVTQPGAVPDTFPEYAKLMGLTATQGKSAMPGPADVGAKLWEHLKRPFYDNGPNDKGLSRQHIMQGVEASLARLPEAIASAPPGSAISQPKPAIIASSTRYISSLISGMRCEI